MNTNLLADICDKLETLNPPLPNNTTPLTDKPSLTPTKFHMTDFHSVYSCGTSACFAGFAAYFYPHTFWFIGDDLATLNPDDTDHLLLNYDAFAAGFDIPRDLAEYICDPGCYDTRNINGQITLDTVLQRVLYCINHYDQLNYHDNFSIPC